MEGFEEKIYKKCEVVTVDDADKFNKIKDKIAFIFDGYQDSKYIYDELDLGNWILPIRLKKLNYM